ncbi:hypothetical protein F4809DRAFT_587760 [Biscogniauxia mediterranea]|nr:hypothetical protein F4809DRAFT_587760 [Biscogniauxia mediterranea]
MASANISAVHGMGASPISTPRKRLHGTQDFPIYICDDESPSQSKRRRLDSQHARSSFETNNDPDVTQATASGRSAKRKTPVMDDQQQSNKLVKTEDDEKSPKKRVKMEDDQYSPNKRAKSEDHEQLPIKRAKLEEDEETPKKRVKSEDTKPFTMKHERDEDDDFVPIKRAKSEDNEKPIKKHERMEDDEKFPKKRAKTEDENLPMEHIIHICERCGHRSGYGFF